MSKELKLNQLGSELKGIRNSLNFLGSCMCFGGTNAQEDSYKKLEEKEKELIEEINKLKESL